MNNIIQGDYFESKYVLLFLGQRVWKYMVIYITLSRYKTSFFVTKSYFLSLQFVESFTYFK